MSSTHGQGKVQKDLREDVCEECKIGRAHVVYMPSRNRFFWGCSNSTLERKCKGSKSWQKIEVPDDLRRGERKRVEKDNASEDEDEKKKKGKKNV